MPELPAKKSNNDMQFFDNVFLTLVDDLYNYEMGDAEISDSIKYFKKVNEYNVPHGKKTRGLTVLHSYRYLAGGKATQEDEELACILGWCIEFFQAYFLVVDDIMDRSDMRRGQPCWYRKPEVGLTAINDSLYLEGAMYYILKKYFRVKPYYLDLLELFHETTFQTTIGQYYDLTTGPADRVDFTHFTLDRYKTLVKWKTSFYSFYFPVACAMYMVGINDTQQLSNAKTILLKMGEFYQIQDDYLDVYGDPAVVGKNHGADIKDNKCVWLIIQALQRANVDQRTILENNYGQEDTDKIAKVKAVYKELDLEKIYKDYEENSYKELMALIETLSGSLPKEMFLAFTEKIYKRQK